MRTRQKITINKRHLEIFREIIQEDYEELKEVRKEKPLFDEWKYGLCEGRLNLIEMILNGSFNYVPKKRIK